MIEENTVIEQDQVENKSNGEFGELAKNQQEFLRKFLLYRFAVVTEDTTDFYPFTKGDVGEFRFGAFTMRRTSDLQITAISHFKEFARIFPQEPSSIVASEVDLTLNLPEPTLPDE
jgi:hypothetical protein